MQITAAKLVDGKPRPVQQEKAPNFSTHRQSSSCNKGIHAWFMISSHKQKQNSTKSVSKRTVQCTSECRASATDTYNATGHPRNTTYGVASNPWSRQATAATFNLNGDCVHRAGVGKLKSLSAALALFLPSPDDSHGPQTHCLSWPSKSTVLFFFMPGGHQH